MNEPKKPARLWRWLGACAVLLICSGGTILLGSLAWLFLRPGGEPTAVPPAHLPPSLTAMVTPAPSSIAAATSQLTPTLPATAVLDTDLLAVPEAIEQGSVSPQAELSYTRFFTTTIPWRDYLATAARFRSWSPEAQPTATPGTLQPGARQSFMTIDGPRQAELVAISDHAYFWLEVGLAADQETMIEAAAQLDNYYLQLIEPFGQEQRPGIDQDNRFHVLHYLGAPDVVELGYFNESNQYPATLFFSSNEREMIYLNMSRLEVGSDLYYGTLVHELQHLIQWNLDRNEAVWLNEGLSQLAEKLVGLDTAETIAYLQQPGIRLEHWDYEPSAVYAHYAAAYLYIVYLWEQLGTQALAELTRHPANGLAAVQVVLAGYQPERSLETFSADWAVANYLDDPTIDAAYGYTTLDLQRPFLENRARQLPFEASNTANQYGVHYIDLDFSGPATVTFAGDTLAELTPPPATNGTIWFAPGINSSHATLTADINLSDTATTATTPAPMLEFDAWYDLEADWDFVYLSASADGGATWSLLYPQRAVSGEFGPAFGGRSAEAPGQTDGWVHESISLQRFAGRPLRLRFELLTDAETPSPGFALSGLMITGLKGEAPRWQPEGFVLTEWQLPQKWSVRLIQKGEPAAIVPLTLDERNRAQLPITLGPEGGVLVVMPQTAFVEGTAAYWVRVEQ